MSLQYLKSLNPTFDHPFIHELKVYAKKHHVPIITDEGVHFIIQLLKINKAKKVLEIGTAIGYSAILMSFFANVEVWSIERDRDMFELAQKNIQNMNLTNQIHLIHGDAKEIDLLETQFDMIFIDAAKAAYIDFFNRYNLMLKKGGLIISDNLLFRGQVAHPENIESKNRKQLIKKIDRFNQFVVKQANYDTYIYAIGDGMSVSIKK